LTERHEGALDGEGPEGGKKNFFLVFPPLGVKQGGEKRGFLSKIVKNPPWGGEGLGIKKKGGTKTLKRRPSKGQLKWEKGKYEVKSKRRTIQ